MQQKGTQRGGASGAGSSLPGVLCDMRHEVLVGTVGDGLQREEPGGDPLDRRRKASEVVEERVGSRRLKARNVKTEGCEPVGHKLEVTGLVAGLSGESDLHVHLLRSRARMTDQVRPGHEGSRFRRAYATAAPRHRDISGRQPRCSSYVRSSPTSILLNPSSRARCSNLQKESRATTENHTTTISRRKTDESSRPTMHPVPRWSSTDGKRPCRRTAAGTGRRSGSSTRMVISIARTPSRTSARPWLCQQGADIAESEGHHPDRHIAWPSCRHWKFAADFAISKSDNLY